MVAIHSNIIPTYPTYINERPWFFPRFAKRRQVNKQPMELYEVNTSRLLEADADAGAKCWNGPCSKIVHHFFEKIEQIMIGK